MDGNDANMVDQADGATGDIPDEVLGAETVAVDTDENETAAIEAIDQNTGDDTEAEPTE